MIDFDELARNLLSEKRGIGMVSPFYAETGSARGNEKWPFWIVRNKTCNSLGAVMPRAVAEQLADAMNRATEGQHGT